MKKQIVGNLGPMPEELKGWNWGAFLLTVIWGIGNETFIALLVLLPYVGIVMPFVLGFKGNEWAWKNKEWKSAAHFKEVQRKWAMWGVVLFAVVCLSAAAIMVGIFALLKNNDVYKMSFSQIEQNEEIIRSIGEPVTSSWVVSGNITTSGSTGRAALNYSIKGPKGSGKVEAKGQKSFDRWSVRKIQVMLNEQEKIINIVPL